MASVQYNVMEEVKKLTGGRVTLETAQILREHVLNVCKTGGDGDPLGKDFPVRNTGRQWCLAAWSFLSEQGWLLPARNLLRELWDSHAEAQRSSKQRVYRALLSQLLTQTTHQLGNGAEALRWSLLTQADDILGGHRHGGGYGKHWLYAIFGLSDVERKALDAVAAKCRKEAEANGWDSPSGFAEEVLRRFVQNDENGRAVFQRLSGTEEFHLTRSYLRVLLDHMDDAPDNQSKGKRLEDVAFYFFSLLPGCVPRRNLRDRAGASEYDLVVSNMSPTSSLIGDVFGRDFLIECKNWNKTVGAEHVGYFLFRMSLTHCRFGVILSRQGITAKSNGKGHAEALIDRAFHEHGSACVVVSMSDLEDLARGQIAGVTSLLIERLSELRFGKQK
jgi:hypothetical protein